MSVEAMLSAIKKKRMEGKPIQKGYKEHETSGNLDGEAKLTKSQNIDESRSDELAPISSVGNRDNEVGSVEDTRNEWDNMNIGKNSLGKGKGFADGGMVPHQSNDKFFDTKKASHILEGPNEGHMMAGSGEDPQHDKMNLDDSKQLTSQGDRITEANHSKGISIKGKLASKLGKDMKVELGSEGHFDKGGEIGREDEQGPFSDGQKEYLDADGDEDDEEKSLKKNTDSRGKKLSPFKKVHATLQKKYGKSISSY